MAKRQAVNSGALRGGISVAAYVQGGGDFSCISDMSYAERRLDQSGDGKEPFHVHAYFTVNADIDSEDNDQVLNLIFALCW